MSMSSLLIVVGSGPPISATAAHWRTLAVSLTFHAIFDKLIVHILANTNTHIANLTALLGAYLHNSNKSLSLE